jgi:hypothetical protein
VRWKLVVLVLLAGAIAPQQCVDFAGSSVRAALGILEGTLSSTGAGHG